MSYYYEKYNYFMIKSSQMLIVLEIVKINFLKSIIN